MLEKMGWTKGKGLGANEEGQLNFIKVSHKSDQKGVGFQDRDDQWTQHENDFNSLLKSLDNSQPASENEQSDNDEKLVCRGFGFASEPNFSEKKSNGNGTAYKLSGESLEELSRKSKKRVHYQKFTKGKDLSKYSEKDLANIFGKKAINLDETVYEPENDSLPSAESVSDSNYGITTITTGTSIADYFHNKKLDLLKTKNLQDENITPNEDQIAADNELPIKKKNKQKRKHEPEFELEEQEQVTDGPLTKSKKKKKQKKETENTGTVVDSNSEEKREMNQVVKKKKKKKERNIISMDPDVIVIEDDPVSDEICNVTPEIPKEDTKQKKKKQKKAKKSTSEESSNDSVEVIKPETSNSNIISNILTTLVDVNNSSIDDSSLAQSDLLTTEQRMASFPTGTFEINRYQAELFRFVDLEGFQNANISDITGYGFDTSIDLKITANTRDNRKISDLWDYALINKYGKEVIQRRKKQKYSIKTLKKKNLFKPL